MTLSRASERRRSDRTTEKQPLLPEQPLSVGCYEDVEAP